MNWEFRNDWIAQLVRITAGSAQSGRQTLLHTLVSIERGGSAEKLVEAILENRETNRLVCVLNVNLPERELAVFLSVPARTRNFAIFTAYLRDFEPAIIRSCFDAGIRHFFSQYSTLISSPDLLKMPPANGVFISDEIVSSFQPNNSTSGDIDTKRNLTKREADVVRLLSRNKTSKEIASILNVSVRTVETHRFNIKRKLGPQSPDHF